MRPSVFHRFWNTPSQRDAFNIDVQPIADFLARNLQRRQRRLRWVPLQGVYNLPRGSMTAAADNGYRCLDFSFSLSRDLRHCDRSHGTGILARVPLLCSSARLSDSNLSGSRSCQRALVASLRQTTGLESPALSLEICSGSSADCAK